MGELGADVEALERLAADVDDRAAVLATIRGRLAAALGSTTWEGPDATRFRMRWRSTYARQLTMVAAELGDVAGELSRQAEGQRRASSGGAVVGGPSRGVSPSVRLVVDAVPTPPTDASPEEVARWWATLSPAQQAALIERDPAMIGARDGIPAVARDQANRALLDEDLDRLRRELDDLGVITSGAELAEAVRLRRELDNVEAVRDYLATVEGQHDPITGEPMVAQLYVYEPGAFDADGRVAIAHGDIDGAEHVAVSVPGITSDVAGMGTGDVRQLYDEARHASGEPVAVVNWMGYDAPSVAGLDIGGTVTREMALAGAEELADDVAGLRASQGDDAPHLTVVAHSYGSTTASWAGAELGLQADDLVLLGSPGAGPADHADDLSTGAANTWVGANSHDPVSLLAETGWVDPTGVLADVIDGPGGIDLLGHDPAEDDFGANRFGAERVGRSWASPVAEHNSYFQPGSESLYNIAAIVGDEHHLVMEADHRYDPLVDADAHLDVDAGVGITRGPFGVPLPDVDVDVDAGVDVDVAMRDPERDRAPTAGHTHAPEDR